MERPEIQAQAEDAGVTGPAWAMDGNRSRQLPLKLVGYPFIFFSVFMVSQFLLGRLGFLTFTLFLVLTFFGLVYAFVSWRSLLVPFLLTVLSVGGFKFLLVVVMPGLPDLYLDRATMVWLVGIFAVKSVVERRPLRGPFSLDTLLFLNALYLFCLILYHDFHNFNLWTKSYLMPYMAFFMAKNIVTSEKSIRYLFVMLVLLNVYYGVTSIGEKLDMAALVWPKSILTAETNWANRSNGPFEHAPLFGTVMGMLMPVYLYFIATARSRAVQLFSYLGMAVSLAGLYFTYTRGSWLAGIVALSMAIFLNRGHYLRVVLPVLILVPLIAVSVLGIGGDPVMKARVENDETLTSRLGVAVTGFRMWRDNPIFGVGFSKWHSVRESYIAPVEVPVFGSINFQDFRRTSIHDIYIGPLAETGLVGALLQFFIYLAILRLFLRKYRDPHLPEHFRRYIMPIFGGFFCGYLVGGIAIDYRFFSMVGVIFYTAAGILSAYDGDEDIHFGENWEEDRRELHGQT